MVKTYSVEMFFQMSSLECALNHLIDLTIESFNNQLRVMLEDNKLIDLPCAPHNMSRSISERQLQKARDYITYDITIPMPLDKYFVKYPINEDTCLRLF